MCGCVSVFVLQLCIYNKIYLSHRCWPITNPFWWLAFRIPMYILQCVFLQFVFFIIFVFSLFSEFIRWSCCRHRSRCSWKLITWAFMHFHHERSLVFHFEWNFGSLFIYLFCFLTVWVAIFTLSNRKKTNNNTDPATTIHKMDDITLFILAMFCVYMCVIRFFSQMAVGLIFSDGSRLSTCFIVHCFIWPKRFSLLLMAAACEILNVQRQ